MNKRNAQPPMMDMWEKKFNALCYQVFYQNPEGKELLTHLENRYFRSPVANPGQDPAWAFFNEGKNELIRSFSLAIQKFLNEAQTKSQSKTTGKKVNV